MIIAMKKLFFEILIIIVNKFRAYKALKLAFRAYKALKLANSIRFVVDPNNLFYELDFEDSVFSVVVHILLLNNYLLKIGIKFA